MKIGYTGWTWDVDEYRNYAPFNEHHKENFEQFLREIADLGYETAENFSFIADYYADDVEGFRAVTSKYGIEFANLYFYFSADEAGDCERAKRYVEFARAVGCTHMNMQGVMWKDEPLRRPLDEQTILSYARRSDVIGRLCAQAGIRACMHPHANTAVFTQEEIDLYLANTAPETVSLCIDTAHTTLAGMCPADAARRYAGRIGYVHLKDIDPDENAHREWPMRRFLPLGYGCIDFKGFVQALREGGYDGILCVELDYQPVCNYKSAMDSRNYIRNVLHL